MPAFDEKILMWVDANDDHVSRGVIRGSWEPDETGFIASNLRAGQAFVDIGANVGWFSMLASTIVGPSESIKAFEPRPDTGSYLEKTIALNRLKDVVTLHRAGLWSEPGELFLLWNGHAANPGASWLTAQDHGEGNGSKVPLVTLDSLEIARCDLVKMDIEGAEPHAVRGARQTLMRFRPPILSELHEKQLRRVSDCSAADYLRLMESMNYGARVLGGTNNGLRIQSTDDLSLDAVTSVAFVPDDRTDLFL